MDFKSAIARAVAAAVGMEQEQAFGLLETPPNKALGDYAFPCFRLAKELRKAPPAIAAELAGSIVLPAGVQKAEAAGPYVNFSLDRAAFAAATLDRVFAEGAQYGRQEIGHGKNVCID